ncbi:MAG: LETM1-related biofilm-associated protein [Psychroflexus sp.]|nr:LETM1-related biofilm-associated protein [Psychroflexus sp.]MDR9449367.1 LETM1-related biofilm-associated protein [Psychroflexus sp.]
MNPSSSGWFKKMLSEQHKFLDLPQKESQLYTDLRDVGFIYGTNILPVSKFKNQHFNLTSSELAKVNLAQALIKTYRYQNDQPVVFCVDSLLAYYQLLKKENKFKFSLKLQQNPADRKLENILHQRVKTDVNLLQKQFSHVITNVLLYIDVLGYKRFLNKDEAICDFLTSYENFIINLIYLNLQQKSISKKAKKIITQMFISSLRYNNLLPDDCVELDELDVSFIHKDTEKLYAFDCFLLATYMEKDISHAEDLLIRLIGEKLNLSPTDMDDAKNRLQSFITQNKDQIKFYRTSNPIKNFYSNTSKRVSLLIYRNKNRLVREIKANRELYKLLTLSMYRELDQQEKIQVNQQLKDVLKTIPSLAIFALPGGGVLLPLIVQLIPKLLPHSFDENRES